jgi:hypothetical protein
LAGKFRDKLRVAEEERASLNESITVRQGAEAASHSGGFDTWLRSRGDSVKARAPALAPAPAHAPADVASVPAAGTDLHGR